MGVQPSMGFLCLPVKIQVIVKKQRLSFFFLVKKFVIAFVSAK